MLTQDRTGATSSRAMLSSIHLQAREIQWRQRPGSAAAPWHARCLKASEALYSVYARHDQKGSPT